MRDIFTDYVNAWLLWGKNHERHARMAEALLQGRLRQSMKKRGRCRDEPKH